MFAIEVTKLVNGRVFRKQIARFITVFLFQHERVGSRQTVLSAASCHELQLYHAQKSSQIPKSREKQFQHLPRNQNWEARSLENAVFSMIFVPYLCSQKWPFAFSLCDRAKPFIVFGANFSIVFFLSHPPQGLEIYKPNFCDKTLFLLTKRLYFKAFHSIS